MTDDSDSEDGEEGDGPLVRLAVQQIITAQVVLRDRAERDRLLDECVGLHGEEVLDCITGFIYSNAVDGVVPEIAVNRFFYLLTRITDLMEFVAQVNGTDPHDVLTVITAHDWTYSDDPDEAASDEATDAIAAMRAAQTCLIAHHFVRRGAAPWGIQRSLDLDDMCAVVDALGMILISLNTLIDVEHHTSFARVLLSDVEMILQTVASWRSVPVAEVVSSYFMALILDDPT